MSTLLIEEKSYGRVKKKNKSLSPNLDVVLTGAHGSLPILEEMMIGAAGLQGISFTSRG